MNFRMIEFTNGPLRVAEAVSIEHMMHDVWRVWMADGSSCTRPAWVHDRDNLGWRNLPYNVKPRLTTIIADIVMTEAEKREVPPTIEGRYLVCLFEWVGSAKEKPKKPHWETRWFWPERGWQKTEYRCDTGNYENFEVVAWQPLPPLPE